MTRLVLLTLLAGCFESIAPTTPDAAAPTGTTDGPFATRRGDGGVYVTVVDATSPEAWTHGDFDAGLAVGSSEPWDLRFQRFHIESNTGVEVAAVERAFEDVVVAPTEGWRTDAFAASESWYVYDAATHVLMPRPIVWVVRTTERGLIKLAIARYYDDAGTAGWLTLRWAAL